MKKLHWVNKSYSIRHLMKSQKLTRGNLKKEGNFFSDGDEIKILKGVIDFKRENGLRLATI